MRIASPPPCLLLVSLPELGRLDPEHRGSHTPLPRECWSGNRLSTERTRGLLLWAGPHGCGDAGFLGGSRLLPSSVQRCGCEVVADMTCQPLAQ